MSNINRFIIVDDDTVSNTLTRLSINKAISNIESKFFTMPEKALEYIESEYSSTAHAVPAIILLEINIATMSGWEFLDAFSAFPSSIKKHFILCILSSSIDERDKERAHTNPLISEYLEKPLSMETVRRIFFFNKGLIKGNSHISSGPSKESMP